jgi:hypothetical protein
MSPIATPATDDFRGTPASSMARQHPHTVAMLQRKDEEEREGIVSAFEGERVGKEGRRKREEEKKRKGGDGVNEDEDRAGRWR